MEARILEHGLGIGPGAVEPNLNRWAGQIGARNRDDPSLSGAAVEAIVDPRDSDLCLIAKYHGTFLKEVSRNWVELNTVREQKGTDGEQGGKKRDPAKQMVTRARFDDRRRGLRRTKLPSPVHRHR